MLRAVASRRSFPARVVRDDPREHGFPEPDPIRRANLFPTAGEPQRRGMHLRRTRRDSFLEVPHRILATLRSRHHADQPERLSAHHERFHRAHHRGPAPPVWFRSWVRGRAAVLRDSWPRRYWARSPPGPDPLLGSWRVGVTTPHAHIGWFHAHRAVGAPQAGRTDPRCAWKQLICARKLPIRA